MDINFNLEDFVPEDSPLDNSLVEPKEEQPVQETPAQPVSVMETAQEDTPVVQQEVEFEPDAQAAFETFKRLGVIDDDSFDGSFESIQTALEEREKNRTAEVATAFIDQAPEKYRMLLQLVYNELDDNEGEIAADRLQKFVDAFKEDSKSDTIRDEEDARDYLEKIYLEKGMRKAAVKAQLDELELDDELMAEAKRELEERKQLRQRELLEEQEKQYNEVEQKRAIFMQHLEKEFHESGWAPTRVMAVKQTLAQTKDIMAKVSSSPKAVAQFADFLSYYKNGAFDIEAYSKQAASKQVQQFKDNIVKSSFRNKTTDKRPGSVGETLLKDFIPV